MSLMEELLEKQKGKFVTVNTPELYPFQTQVIDDVYKSLRQCGKSMLNFNLALSGFGKSSMGIRQMMKMIKEEAYSKEKEFYKRELGGCRGQFLR